MKLRAALRPVKNRFIFIFLGLRGRMVGLNLHHSQYREFAWQMVRGTYEKEIVEEMMRWLPVNGVFADIGANIGYVTVAAARRAGPGGRVFSFEPNPVLFPTLLKNANRHRCVLAINKAVGSKDGELPFYVGDCSDTGSLSKKFVNFFPCRNLKETRVSVCRAECILRENDQTRVDVLKLDVEGFEQEALAGLGTFLDPEITKHLFIEINPLSQSAFGHSIENLLGIVTEKGYRIFGTEKPWKGCEILLTDYQKFEADLGEGYTTVHCRI